MLRYHVTSGRRAWRAPKKLRTTCLLLILTVVPNWTRVGRAVVEHCCFLITQKPLDGDDVREYPLTLHTCEI
ncbi:hypothetical protein JOM56_010023 [Amanita muscaria]